MGQFIPGPMPGPPEFIQGLRGPPLEFLAIELVYFLVVAGLCLLIYFKTKEIYRISQHRGIFYFRNIFLFFALAYLFRLMGVGLIMLDDPVALEIPRMLYQASLFLAGYFGTMAILCLAMAMLIRNVKKESKNAYYALHGIALVLSLLIATERSSSALLAMQTAILACALLIFFIKTRGKKASGFSQNKITYLLLAIFWIINLLAFSRIPMELKIPLYIISAGIFLSIFLRVRKRLSTNGKKKKPA
ncbi:MAG: hypothetical protein WC634_01680 [archaeon]